MYVCTRVHLSVCGFVLLGALGYNVHVRIHPCVLVEAHIFVYEGKWAVPMHMCMLVGRASACMAVCARSCVAHVRGRMGCMQAFVRGVRVRVYGRRWMRMLFVAAGWRMVLRVRQQASVRSARLCVRLRLRLCLSLYHWPFMLVSEAAYLCLCLCLPVSTLRFCEHTSRGAHARADDSYHSS